MYLRPENMKNVYAYLYGLIFTFPRRIYSVESVFLEALIKKMKWYGYLVANYSE